MIAMEGLRLFPGPLFVMAQDELLQKERRDKQHSQSESLLKRNFIVPATNQPTNKGV